MRVTFFSNFNQPCGIADYSHNLIEEIEKLATVEVVQLPANLRADGSFRSYVSCAYRFYRLGKKMNRGDICHIQHEFAFWSGFFLRTNMFPFFARGIKVPVVMTAHELIDPPFKISHNQRGLMRLAGWLFGSLFRRYERYVNGTIFARPDYTIVHTTEQKQQLIARGVASYKIIVIPHGISRADTLGHGEDYLIQCGLKGRRYFTLVGFLTERKGYDLVLNVLSRLPEDIVFVIAGGPRLEEDHAYTRRLRSRINHEGLDSRVLITGYLKPAQLGAILSGASAVVAPFERVSGSGSLSLALAFGKAIVASDLSSLKELHRKSRALLLFPSGNADQLLRCLLTVFEDEALRSELEKAAYSYAEKNSFKVVAGKTYRIYEDLLKKAF